VTRGARGLVVLVALAAGACSLVGRSGCPGPRRFYLTKETVPGDRALEACASGYHMASRFEIADVASVVYDPKRGLTTDDSGAGPPSMAAKYTSDGAKGWIRTGGDARYSGAAADPPDAATLNCAAWSTSSASALGTVAYLTDAFAVDHGTSVVWGGGPEKCDARHHVWCVGDYPSHEEAEEERPRGLRRLRDEMGSRVPGR
jgi:hypothetical protein